MSAFLSFRRCRVKSCTMKNGRLANTSSDLWAGRGGRPAGGRPLHFPTYTIQKPGQIRFAPPSLIETHLGFFSWRTKGGAEKKELPFPTVVPFFLASPNSAVFLLLPPSLLLPSHPAQRAPQNETQHPSSSSSSSDHLMKGGRRGRERPLPRAAAAAAEASKRPGERRQRKGEGERAHRKGRRGCWQ